MLQWFDTNPSHYWVIAWSAFGALLFASLVPLLGELSPAVERRLPRRWFPAWLFCALLAVNFFAFRWPLFFFESELNPDESQLIAGAITLQHDPVYWRSINGTTHGPLDVYPLLLARWFFLPPDYGSARLVGALLMLGAIFCAYGLLVRAFGEGVARVGVLPLACFLSFLTYWDLVHYSSEHVPVALLALAVAALGRELVRSGPKPGWTWCWFAGGLALGAAPFAKLQAGPIAAVVFLAAILLEARRLPAWRQRFARAGILAAGALVVPLGFLLMTVLSGTTSYVWRAYVLHNVIYAGDHHHPLQEMLTGFVDFVRQADGLHPFLAGCAALTLAGTGLIFKFTRSLRHLLLLEAAFVSTSFFAVIYPGRLYTHYLLLLVFPAGMLVAGLFGACWEISPGRLVRTLLLLVFCGLGVAPQVWSRGQRAHPYVGQLGESQARARGEVARTILRYAHCGEPLGQWGWMPRFHVQTRMPHATPEAHSALEIAASPLRDFHRERYLARLNAAPPPVFIDSVGPGNFVYQDRTETGHETWPELAEFITARYSLVADVEGTRIYVRKDRRPETPP